MITFLINDWLESPKRLIEGFLPKILGPWWGPTKAFCSSVNADEVGIVIAGGEDT